MLTVQVIYAQADSVWVRTVSLAAGSTALQAVQASGFLLDHKDYVAEQLALGVFGRPCSPDRMLDDGDRVEVYRPLVFDAMESRRRRAIHRQAFTTKPKNRPKRRTVPTAVKDELITP